MSCGENHGKFKGTVNSLWSKATSYEASEKSKNGRRSTVTPIGRRGKKPVGKR